VSGLIWGLGALIFVGIAALPFLIEFRRAPVSAEDRTASGYQFADLSKGVTAYRWHGPTRGPVIVAVHGLTTPSQVWDDLIPHFTSIGYRVVTYDLYGRGLSDAPAGVQNAAFFQRQLNDLLDHLELKEEVILMGYSMGGAIVTGYAATYRSRIDRVFLIAGAGMRINETAFEKATRLLPILGDWLSAAFLARIMRRDLEANPGSKVVDQIRAKQLSQAGYLPAVQSSRRHQLSYQQKAEHRILGQEGIKLCAIWGDEDMVIPISSSGLLAQWNRQARQDVIKGARHDLLQSHPTEVANSIKQLLNV